MSEIKNLRLTHISLNADGSLGIGGVVRAESAWDRALAKSWPPEKDRCRRLPWPEYAAEVGPRWCPGCESATSLLSPGFVVTQCGACDWAWLGPNGDGSGRRGSS